MPGDLSASKRLDGLDEPGHAGRGIHVTVIGLHGPHQHWRIAVDGKHPIESVEFHRIPERRPRTVGLDVAHFGGPYAGVRQGIADNGLLCRGIGHGLPGTRAVVIHRRSTDDRKHPVTVGQSPIQRLEHDDTATFAPDDAVGRGVENTTASRRRDRPDLAHEHGQVRAEHEVDATGEGDVGLPRCQAAAGEVDGDQRRRAGGVHRHRRSMGAQLIGQPSGTEAELLAGGVVRVDAGHAGFAGMQKRVVHPQHAHVDRRPAAIEASRRQPGIRERFPGDLQQQALLRIHLPRFGRRQAEESGIEGVHIVQKRPFAAVGGPRPTHLRVMDPLHVPAPARRCTHRVHTIGENSPQPLTAITTAGKTTARTDYRDRLIPLRHGASLRLRQLKRWARPMACSDRRDSCARDGRDCSPPP